MVGMGACWGGSPMDHPQAALKTRSPAACRGMFGGDPQFDAVFDDACSGFVTNTGGGTADRIGCDLRVFTACQE